jgi:hypothetical protein
MDPTSPPGVAETRSHAAAVRRGPQHGPAGWRDPWLLAALAAFAGLAALAGAPHLVDFDSAQFALAVSQHDPALHQPQPPGFVLYVWLTQAVARLGPGSDAYAALRLVAVGLLLGAAWCLYALAGSVADRTTARWAVLLLLSSPLVLFHGLTTAVYPAEAFASALAALLYIRVGGEPRRLAAMAAVAGLLAGLRPTTGLVTVPLLVLAAWRGRFTRRALAIAAACGAAALLAWFLPELAYAGGSGRWFEMNRMLQSHIRRTSVVVGGWPHAQGTLHRGLDVLVFGVGVARLAVWLAGLRGRRVGASTGPQRGPGPARLDARFALVWTAPLLLFTALYILPKPGYLLALWPPIALGLALRRRNAAALGVAVGLDVALFFGVPTMHLCCRDPAELAEAATPGESTLVQRPWVPAGWMHPLDWPRPLRAAAQVAFGRVDFFFDRTRDFDFGGALQALRRHAGLPRSDTLVLGFHVSRAVCWEIPEQLVLHPDAARAQRFVVYRDRHGTPVEGTWEIPAHVRHLLVERDAGTLRFAPGGGQPLRTEAMPRPLGGRFVRHDLGAGPLEARLVLPASLGRRGGELRLVRAAHRASAP